MQETQLAQISTRSHRSPGRMYRVAKRVMDCVLAVLLLIVISPLMMLIALWIKIDTRGPVLFRQTRLGLDAQPFTLYKFRTMFQEADPEVHRHHVQSLIRRGNAAGNDWSAAPAEKLEADPRVTDAGRFLRRTSLDELPQLFNVVLGNMSLVGPRPPIPYEVQEYQDWHRARLQVLPGITGWWQVHGRSRVSFDGMVQMDLAYIANQSIWLDIKLILLTIPAVISGKGAK